MQIAITILQPIALHLQREYRSGLLRAGYVVGPELAENMQAHAQQIVGGFQLKGNLLWHSRWTNDDRLRPHKGVPIERLIMWLRSKKTTPGGKRIGSAALAPEYSAERKSTLPGSYMQTQIQTPRTADSPEDLMHEIAGRILTEMYNTLTA